MPLFRDIEGNHFSIPAEELERFRVAGALPEDARLTGLEVPTPPPPPPPGAPALPRYVWRQAEHEGGPGYTVQAPSEAAAALDGRAFLLVPAERAGGGAESAG